MQCDTRKIGRKVSAGGFMCRLPKQNCWMRTRIPSCLRNFGRVTVSRWPMTALSWRLIRGRWETAMESTGWERRKLPLRRNRGSDQKTAGTVVPAVFLSLFKAVSRFHNNIDREVLHLVPPFFAPTRALKNKCYFAIKHIFSSERLQFHEAVSIITLKWSKKE